MLENQEKIDAWYNNFIQQIAQPPYSLHPSIPGDVGRIFKLLDEPKDNQEAMEEAITSGEDLYAKRNELYKLAASGELYIFPLKDDKTCDQIRVEPADNLIHKLNEAFLLQEAPPIPDESEKSLGFFKNILNFLFGAYEEERLQLLEAYEEKVNTYNLVANGVHCITEGARTMNGRRYNQMRELQEASRESIPTMISDLKDKLEKKTGEIEGFVAVHDYSSELKNDETLLPWQKDMYEAQITLFTALQNGQALSPEQYEDILAKVIVGRMGDYKNIFEFRGQDNEMTGHSKLQTLLHEEPEKANELVAIIKSSPYIHGLANEGNLLSISSRLFSAVSLDETVKNTLTSLKDSNDEMQKWVDNIKKMMKIETSPAPKKQELPEANTASHNIGAM